MYDLQEQEQLDELKAWWKENGRRVITIVVVFALGAAAVQGWRHYQQTQARQAAALYGTLEELLPGKDAKKIQEMAGAIVEKFPSTAYATRAALIAAKTNYDSGDVKSAKAQLQWVIDHASEDELRDMARLRLGGALLDEKNYAEALSLLEAKHSPAYDPLFYDLKGDILVAQGKTAEARDAYQTALDKSDKKSNYRSLIQVKLDALGGK
ncbi:MAG TPA: tetratricopeptide repeat protein [Burkholderiales bacterium]|nr:tetratricopeptide repeat protein [Burkholderiales bacterium]